VKTGQFWLSMAMSVALVAVVAYILVRINPLDDDEPKTLTASDVAQAWNQSIERLGIIPVYPPQEDLRVGDIWAVVVKAPEKDEPRTTGKADARSVPKYDVTPLLGKSSRIERLDLRKEIVDGDKGRSIFPATAALAATTGYRSSDPWEEENSTSKANSGVITTSIVALPFITINYAGKAGGSGSWGWFGAGGSEATQQIEQVRIKGVESYGAPGMDAYGRLDKWCKAKAFICEDDEVARRYLATAIDSKVLHVEKDASGKDQYTTRIELRLITRVYMTREIETSRWTVDSRGAVVQLAPDPNKLDVRVSVDPGKPGDAARDPAGAAALPGTAQAAASTGSQSVKFSSLRSSALEVGINGVFQRPVAIGYRAITIELPLSTPPPPPSPAKP
jgi:hypothetical protein